VPERRIDQNAGATGPDGERNSMLDVTGSRLAELVRGDDPHVETEIARLTQLLGRSGTTSGWQSFLDSK
jgi:hypothetical protein